MAAWVFGVALGGPLPYFFVSVIQGLPPAKLHEIARRQAGPELLTLSPLISARFYLRPGSFEPADSKGDS
jgi:hypothetical protein